MTLDKTEQLRHDVGSQCGQRPRRCGNTHLLAAAALQIERSGVSRLATTPTPNGRRHLCEHGITRPVCNRRNRYRMVRHFGCFVLGIDCIRSAFVCALRCGDRDIRGVALFRGKYFKLNGALFVQFTALAMASNGRGLTLRGPRQRLSGIRRRVGSGVMADSTCSNRVDQLVLHDRGPSADN